MQWNPKNDGSIPTLLDHQLELDVQNTVDIYFSQKPVQESFHVPSPRFNRLVFYKSDSSAKRSSGVKTAGHTALQEPPSLWCHHSIWCGASSLTSWCGWSGPRKVGLHPPSCFEQNLRTTVWFLWSREQNKNQLPSTPGFSY